MNTNTFTVSQMLVMHHTQMQIAVTFNNAYCSSLLYLILGLQCLKNWRNLGIIMLRGLFRASLSSSSDESSQIFCSAPNEPWDTDIHREAVKSNANIQGHRGENETASENKTRESTGTECTQHTSTFLWMSEAIILAKYTKCLSIQWKEPASRWMNYWSLIINHSNCHFVKSSIYFAVGVDFEC